MSYHFTCIVFMKVTNLCSENGLFRTVIENELLINFKIQKNPKTTRLKSQLPTKAPSIVKSNVHHPLIKADISRSREKVSKGYEAAL